MPTLRVNPDGTIQCVYTESLDLRAFGNVSTRRASHVEPTANGRWAADLSPVGGPSLGPFDLRSQALTAEVEWLERKLTKDGLAGERRDGE